MNKYSNAVEPIVVPTPKEGREYLHTTTAGVKVPLLQAVTLGGTVFLFVLVLGIVFWWMDPLKPAVIAGGSVGLGWLVWALWRWSNLTRPDQPTVQVRSVDHDNDASTPKVIRIRLSEVRKGGHYWSSEFDLPEGTTEEQMEAFAVGVLQGKRPISRREWTIKSDTFSDLHWRAFQDVMVKQQLIEMKSKKGTTAGFRLTERGDGWLRKWLSPSPTDEDAENE